MFGCYDVIMTNGVTKNLEKWVSYKYRDFGFKQIPQTHFVSTEKIFSQFMEQYQISNCMMHYFPTQTSARLILNKNYPLNLLINRLLTQGGGYHHPSSLSRYSKTLLLVRIAFFSSCEGILDTNLTIILTNMKENDKLYLTWNTFSF